MIQKVFSFFSILFLLSCSAKVIVPEPYDMNKTPEDRHNYNGLTGYSQRLKDEKYLFDKEQVNKCQNAQIDLAEAKAKGSDTIDRARQLETLVNEKCK